MIINEIISKKFRLCDFEEREKSVIYKDVDLDSLLFKNAIDYDSDFEVEESMYREDV